MDILRAANGRFLRHRFSPKPKVIATTNSLPQKEITLLKRRRPRRGKPERDNGANESANQTMLQGRSRGLA